MCLCIYAYVYLVTISYNLLYLHLFPNPTMRRLCYVEIFVCQGTAAPRSRGLQPWTALGLVEAGRSHLLQFPSLVSLSHPQGQINLAPYKWESSDDYCTMYLCDYLYVRGGNGSQQLFRICCCLQYCMPSFVPAYLIRRSESA